MRKKLSVIAIVLSIVSIVASLYGLCQVGKFYPKSGEVICSQLAENQGYVIKGSLVTR